MAFDFCLLPPNPSSARDLHSFLPLSHGHNPLKNYEFILAWMRAFQKIQMAVSTSYRFPRENVALVYGTVTGVSGSTLTDSGAAFTSSSSIRRCGIITPLSGARVRIYVKNDPRYVATAKVTSILSATTLKLSNFDFVERGQVTSLSDLTSCQYAIFDPLDIDCYDRWMNPPNARGYVSQYELARDGHRSGSFGSFCQKLITVTGTDGSYTLNTGGGSTAAISSSATALDIQNAISSAVSGQVIVILLGSRVFAVGFGPGISQTLSVNVDSLTGGTVTVGATATGTVYDNRLVFAGPHKNGPLVTNLFATPQPSFPDQPTSFKLVIYDSGNPSDPATATATVTPTGGLSLGQIDIIGVVNPGSGYTSSPTVTLLGGATATAIVETGTIGTVAKILVGNAGFNYTAPTVIVNGDGTGCTATATVDSHGAISGFTVTNPGTGYTHADITITDATGVLATGLVVLVGGISAFTVTSRGSGFTVPPPLTVSGGGGTGATGRVKLASGPITSITVTHAGNNYQSEPSVGITSSGIGDHGGSATAVLSGATVGSITVDSGGNYTVTPIIALAGGGGDMSVHRFTITANTDKSITVGSLGGWIPSLGFYYDVIATDPHDGNSIWNPNALAGERQIWNTGAYNTENGLTHRDNDTIANYPQAAEVVYFDGGDGGPCDGPSGYNAADIDVINGCCNPDCCSRGNRFYAPNIWKSTRYWQIYISGFGAPWVFLPLYSDKTQLPPFWKFSDVMAYLGFNSAGFYVPYHKTFKLMEDSIAFVATLDDNGDPIDPPGVGTATTPASATSHLTLGIVTSVTIGSGGHNQSIPLVGFTGGGGTGATGHAVLTGDAVSSVVVDSGGSGYTSAPTVVFSLGGIIGLGSWSQEDISSNYLFYDYGVGETGSVFAAGDVAQYQGMQDYQQTLPGFRAGFYNPTAKYLDYKWVGTCGANPTNLKYAGKILKSNDPLNENYHLYQTTRISSNGTGIYKTMSVKSFRNSAGLTTQVKMDAFFWDYWFEASTITTISGTATGGTANTLVDSSAPFTLDDLGQNVNITHSTTHYAAIIDGISNDLKTIHFQTIGYTPVAGDTYIFTRQTYKLDSQEGIVTGGSTTTMIDSTRVGSPYFASDIYPDHAILENFHDVSGVTIKTKFWITGTNQSTGQLTLEAVGGISPSTGDRWRVLRTRHPNRFRKIWATFIPLPTDDIGAGVGTAIDVQLKGDDSDTLFISSPPAGFTLTGTTGVTCKLNIFRPGSVLKRNPANTRWLDTATQTETRTDPETGLIPPFKKDNFLNKPGYIDRYGFRTIMTITTTDMWNQMWSVIQTLLFILSSGGWNNRGEDNFVTWTNGTDNWPLAVYTSGGTAPGLIYFTDANYAIRAMATTGRNDADPDPPGALTFSGISTPPYTYVELYVGSDAMDAYGTFVSVGSTDTASAHRKSDYYDGTYLSCLAFSGSVTVHLYSRSRAWIYPDDQGYADGSHPFVEYPTSPASTLIIQLDAQGDLVDTTGKYEEWDAPVIASDGTWMSTKQFGIALRHEPTIDASGLGPFQYYISGYKVNGDFALIDFSAELGSHL